MTATAEKLPEFEGELVHQAEVRITNAGDGLSEALKIAPETLHIGDQVHYVLEGVVTQVNHRTKGNDDDIIIRVHTIKAGAITKVDAKVAEKILSQARDELEKAKAEAQGQLMMDAENEAAAKEARD